MTDNQKQAVAYIAAALNEYAGTLPPTVRGPFIREAQAALKVIEDSLKPAESHG